MASRRSPGPRRRPSPTGRSASTASTATPGPRLRPLRRDRHERSHVRRPEPRLDHRAQVLGHGDRRELQRVAALGPRPVPARHMSRALRRDDGFTMIELLLVCVISLVVFGATVTAWTSIYRSNRALESQQDNAESARVALDRAARQLRNLANPTVS